LNKLKDFLGQIGSDLVEVKERLTKEWRTNYPKRLNLQMHAAEERLADLVTGKGKNYFLEILGKLWASSINQLYEEPNSTSLSELRRAMEPLDEEIRLRMEEEIEDTEFRLKRGSDLGRFDQFWDDNTLFECRYSQSKWLGLWPQSTVPHEIYSHALKGNNDIIHITFGFPSDLGWIQDAIRDLPRVTSLRFYAISSVPGRRHPLFIKSKNNDLTTFAKEIRPELDPFSTYIFTDADYNDMFSVQGRFGLALVDYAKVLISFVAPTSGRLILRLTHSGDEDAPLEITLGSTIIQLNPSTKSSITIDDITLYPIQDRGPSKPDRLSFEEEIRNDIVIQFRGLLGRHHLLHDIELLNEDGLKQW
jgi:hypothetical protein